MHYDSKFCMFHLLFFFFLVFFLCFCVFQTVFISFALVDRLGRKPLMLGALLFMSIGAGLLALAYQVFPDHKVN